MPNWNFHITFTVQCSSICGNIYYTPQNHAPHNSVSNVRYLKWVINYRNMKLYVNKGSCVLTKKKVHVFKHCKSTTGSTTNSHSAFNVFNIMIRIGHITEWRSRIIKIIYTLLKLLNACSLSKTWLHTPTLFSTLCDLFQKLQISLSLHFNNQLLIQAAGNKCLMEMSITNKLIHQN